MATLAAKGAPITAYESPLWPETGTALVNVVDRDAAAVATGLTATFDSVEACWKVALTHVHTAALGELTLTWTHSTGPTHVSTVDVRGANPYPTSVLAKILTRGGSTPTAAGKQLAMQAAVESLEDACDVALVTRRSVEEHIGTGTSFRSNFRSITEVISVDGVAVSDATISGQVITLATSATDPVIVVDHGDEALGSSAARAVALLASSTLVDGPWDDRGFAVTDAQGSMRLLTQGVGRAKYSIPEVQEFYRRRAPVLVR